MSSQRRSRTVQALEVRALMAADLGAALPELEPADDLTPIAVSTAFGVEREMKESGEKGGTADINIGVGELQECTISKSMDTASPKLAQAAINGNSCGTAEIDFVEVAGSGDYSEPELDQAFADLGSTTRY